MGLEESKLEPEVLDDIFRQTSYTKDQISEMHKKFAGIYKNGHLTIEQFKSAFGKTFPDGDPSEFAEHMFRAFDTNGDGVVDFREYLFALYIDSHGQIDQKLEFVFSLYDIDGSGEITWSELEEVLKSVHKVMGIRRMPADAASMKKRASKLFNLLDRNKDGRIQLEEFIDTVKRDPDVLRQLRASIMPLR